jgi:hypothetical protein
MSVRRQPGTGTGPGRVRGPRGAAPEAGCGGAGRRVPDRRFRGNAAVGLLVGVVQIVGGGAERLQHHRALGGRPANTTGDLPLPSEVLILVESRTGRSMLAWPL